MKIFSLWDKLNQCLIQSIICRLEVKGYRSQEQIERIHYSLNCLINEVSKAVLLFLVFFIQGAGMRFFICYVTLVSMRIFLGGSHRKTMLGCFLQSVLFFEGIIVLNSYIELNREAHYAIWLLTIVWIWRYAPTSWGTRASYSVYLRMRFKAMAVTALAILMMIIEVIPNSYADAMSWTIAVQLLESCMVVLLKKRKEVTPLKT